MATKIQTTPASPSSRFSRFNLFAKSPSPSPKTPPARRDDSEWYIPYNGPYEIPKDAGPRSNRDSWGDVLNDAHRDLFPPSSDPHARARVVSHTSHMTGSSGAIDPSRKSFTSTVRPRTTSPPRLPTPSYIHLGAAGGVGDTPRPRTRSPTSAPGTRLSFASIFNARKPSMPNLITRLPPPDEGAHYRSPTSPLTHPRVVIPPRSPSPDEDMYGMHHRSRLHPPSPDALTPTSSHNTFTSHPYASAMPVPDNKGKARADDHQVRLALPPAVPPFLKPATRSKSSLAHSLSRLKGSLSTPNLRLSVKQQRDRLTPELRTPEGGKGRDRWLSAETWCDALLFPRPRFKVKDGSEGSGRVVSPTLEVVSGDSTERQQRRQPHLRKVRSSIGEARPQVPMPWSGTEISPVAEEAVADARFRGNTLPPQLLAPNGKRFSWDDMALPSPVPSLAKVLEDGERLERERRAWQSQATTSLLNGRTRSMSRMRAKSLSRPRANMLLGSQAVAPTIHLVRFTGSGSTAGTAGTSSHTRTHSHSSHTNTNTASASARGHARTESLGRGIKMAGALCGIGGEQPFGDADSTLDAVFRSGGTKLIRLEDQIRKESGVHERLMVSPTPSGVSVVPSGVGIAISTPLPSVDSHTQEPIMLFNHPYAQPPAAYVRQQTSVTGAMIGAQPAAGPHPSEVPAEPRTSTDVSARHRLPPQATLAAAPPVPHIAHPYAAFGGADEQARTRTQMHPELHLAVDPTPLEGVSPSRSMFAQTGGGYLRQIRPDEIRYSPLPGGQHAYAYRPDSLVAPDDRMLRMGDALSFTLRRRRSRDYDDGRRLSDEVDAERPERPPLEIGAASTEMIVNGLPGPSTFAGGRVRRKPVPYTERPPFEQQPTDLSVPITTHTMASSASGHVNPPEFRASEVMDDVLDSGRVSESTSPPVSPRRYGSSSSDDLDRFRDLFYKPSPPEESALRRKPSRAALPVDVSPRASLTSSALESLTRHVSEELRVQAGKSIISDASSWDWNKHFEGDSSYIDELLKHMTEGRSPRPPPLNLDAHSTPSIGTDNIPEDVSSSRASSPLEQPSPVDHDGNIVEMRFGLVEAVTTPPAVPASMRPASMRPDSGHLPQEDRQALQDDETMAAAAARRGLSSASLTPHSALTRSSYVTTTSDGSRISRLSDFPVPPSVDMTPANISLMQSYFAGHTPRRELEDPMPAIPDAPTRPAPEAESDQRRVRQGKRTTFGEAQFDASLL